MIELKSSKNPVYLIYRLKQLVDAGKRVHGEFSLMDSFSYLFGFFQNSLVDLQLLRYTCKVNNF